jgi:hypothetical protein
MALSACRAVVVPRHGTAREKPLRVVLGPPLRHDGMARHENAVVPGRAGPFRARAVLGPGGPFGILYTLSLMFLAGGRL